MDFTLIARSRHAHSHTVSTLAPLIFDAPSFSHARTVLSAERRRLSRGHLSYRRNGVARLGGALVLPNGEESRPGPGPVQGATSPVHAVGNGPLHKAPKS